MDTLDALIEQQAEMAALLDGLADDDWDRPSRCEGWSLSDVVVHVAQTNDMATASAQGRFDEHLTEMTAGMEPGRSVDDGADLLVRRERGRPGPAVRERWTASAARLRDALGAADPHARVQWVAGQLTVRTLAATRLAETWIHAGDVAHGLGVELAPAPRLRHVARLAWRTLPYAFARAGRDLAGPVAFDLTGPGRESWRFGADADGGDAVTTIRGDGVELCLVAARRVDPAATGLTGDGPDAAAVLELVRTYA